MPAAESAHLARVVRLREGDAIEIFDGRGDLRQGLVRRATANGSVVAVGNRLPAAPEPIAPIVIVQGLLKGDAMDAVVRDATVLGATEVWPVTTSRTNVPARAAHAARERWVRVSIAAAKQCGRAVLPRIAEARDVDAVMTAPPRDVPARLWLTEPSAAGEADEAAAAEVDLSPRGACLAIGPEGGWSPEEMAAAVAAGWQPWTLAPVTLRAEHVALAALSVLRYAWATADRRRNT